mgnify:CR=1 FL=1
MSQNKKPRPRRTFTPELKQQIVDLYRGGKRKCDIIREYDILHQGWAAPNKQR